LGSELGGSSRFCRKYDLSLRLAVFDNELLGMPNIDEPGKDHHEQEASEAKDCIHDPFIAGCRHLFRDAERRLSNPDQVQHR
jgi:hypothetical protein